MLILGIETSCDDTCVSVVQNGTEILSNVISSQAEFHKNYQGVVPSIASMKHSECLFDILKKSLSVAQVSLRQIDAVAVTTRPGLLVSLLIGVNAAKGLSLGLKKPLNFGPSSSRSYVYASDVYTNSISAFGLCFIWRA